MRGEIPHLESVRDSSLCEIIRTDLNFDLVTRRNADPELSKLSGKVTNNFLLVFERDAEVAARKRFFHRASHLNELLFCHNYELILAFSANFGKKLVNSSREDIT